MNLSRTMIGRVTDCVQLTYRTPAESVRKLLPDGLELVVRGPWAFWGVLARRVEKLRPMGMPGILGVTCHQVSYRLLTQAMNDRAEVVRGFYGAHNAIDAPAIARLGRWLSGRALHRATITFEADDCAVRVQSDQIEGAGFGLLIDAAHAPARLADGSCFPTLVDARALSRYVPNTLAAVERDGQRLLGVTRETRVAEVCCETPMAIRQARLGYLESIGQTGVIELEWVGRQRAADCQWEVGQASVLLKQEQIPIQTVRVAS